MQIDIQNKTKTNIRKIFLKKVAEVSIDSLNVKGDYSLGILLVGNRFIQKLNQKYRGTNCPTDVLSFGMIDKQKSFRNTSDNILYLGDVIISIEEAKKNIRQNEVPLETELAELLIHGILHIFGFNHQKKRDRAKMDLLSQKIIKSLTKNKILKLCNA